MAHTFAKKRCAPHSTQIGVIYLHDNDVVFVAVSYWSLVTSFSDRRRRLSSKIDSQNPAKAGKLSSRVHIENRIDLLGFFGKANTRTRSFAFSLCFPVIFSHRKKRISSKFIIQCMYFRLKYKCVMLYLLLAEATTLPTLCSWYQIRSAGKGRKTRQQS